MPKYQQNKNSCRPWETSTSHYLCKIHEEKKIIPDDSA